MKEHHFVYKIVGGNSDLVCSHSEFQEDDMLTLLTEVKQSYKEGLLWIFKQFDNKKREPLSIIDCAHQRIYYHYSGDVEPIDHAIKKLSR